MWAKVQHLNTSVVPSLGKFYHVDLLKFEYYKELSTIFSPQGREFDQEIGTKFKCCTFAHPPLCANIYTHINIGLKDHQRRMLKRHVLHVTNLQKFGC